MEPTDCVNAGLSLPRSMVERLREYSREHRRRPSVVVRELLERFFEEADGAAKKD